jgi:biopolymer transport protein ExbD
MRLRRGRPREEQETMLPLINVVFLLLIFFMLLANVSTYIPFPVTPPVATETGLERHDVMVAIAADGRIALDGAEIDAVSITAQLQDRLRGGTATAVWLNADRETDSDRVIDVMERMRKAGVTEVRLVTKR